MTSTAVRVPVPYTCAACNSQGEGKFVSLGAVEKYHPDCVKCFICSAKITSSFVRLEGKLSCQSCAEARTSKAATTVTVANSGGGLRFNHVTRQAYRVDGPAHAKIVGYTGPAKSAPAAAPAAATTAARPKFCGQCGGALAATGKFCGGCGSAIPGA